MSKLTRVILDRTASGGYRASRPSGRGAGTRRRGRRWRAQAHRTSLAPPYPVQLDISLPRPSLKLRTGLKGTSWARVQVWCGISGDEAGLGRHGVKRRRFESCRCDGFSRANEGVGRRWGAVVIAGRACEQVVEEGIFRVQNQSHLAAQKTAQFGLGLGGQGLGLVPASQDAESPTHRSGARRRRFRTT